MSYDGFCSRNLRHLLIVYYAVAMKVEFLVGALVGGMSAMCIARLLSNTPGIDDASLWAMILVGARRVSTP